MKGNCESHLSISMRARSRRRLSSQNRKHILGERRLQAASGSLARTLLKTDYGLFSMDERYVTLAWSAPQPDSAYRYHSF